MVKNSRSEVGAAAEFFAALEGAENGKGLSLETAVLRVAWVFLGRRRSIGLIPRLLCLALCPRRWWSDWPTSIR